MKPLIVGTRGSALALTQTHWVISQLSLAYPDQIFDIREIMTRGDATQRDNVPLSSFGEKGVFAKELETSLLEHGTDFAVHSMKDMAHTLPEGLVIASIPLRQDPRDVWLGTSISQVGPGFRIGTGSVRRRALLSRMFPEAQLLEIRGNIDSRIRKLKRGDYDAIVLAAAGLIRLGLISDISHTFDPLDFVPDPGQGALAIECRADDLETISILSSIADKSATVAVHAERAFLRELGGGCQTPCGAHAVAEGEFLSLRTLLALPDGSQSVRCTNTGPVSDPVALGKNAGTELRSAANREFPKGWESEYEERV